VLHGVSPFAGNTILAIEGSAVDISQNGLQLIPHGGAAFVNGVATLGNGTTYFETENTGSTMLYGDFTIEVAARCMSESELAYGIFLANKSEPLSHVAFTGQTPGERQMQMISSGAVRVNSGVFANNTDWHEWCITRSGTAQFIYMDGVRLATGAFDGTWQYYPGALIGAQPNVSPSDQFEIELQRLRITRACRYFGNRYSVPETYAETYVQP
jgi:hypothetical protein